MGLGWREKFLSLSLSLSISLSLALVSLPFSLSLFPYILPLFPYLSIHRSTLSATSLSLSLSMSLATSLFLTRFVSLSLSASLSPVHVSSKPKRRNSAMHFPVKSVTNSSLKTFEPNSRNAFSMKPEIEAATHRA